MNLFTKRSGSFRKASALVLTAFVFAQASAPSFALALEGPQASDVHIASSNASTTLAKSGDTITLSFRTASSTGSPVVSIAGESVSPSGSDPYQATYTVGGSDADGTVAFSISLTDGTTTTAFTSVSDGSQVRIDNTKPTVVLTTSDTASSSLVHVTVTFSEEVTGFTADDLSYSSTQAPQSFTMVSGSVYTFTVVPTGSSIDVSIGDQKYADVAGNVNTGDSHLTYVAGGGGGGGEGGGSTTTPATTTPSTGLPTLAITSGPTNGGFVATSTVRFDFTAENASSTRCSLDGAGSASSTPYLCGTPQIFTSLPAGAYIFGLYAMNPAGTTTLSSWFTIDLTAPIITEAASTTVLSDTTASYSFTSNEAGTIRYAGDCSATTTSALIGTTTVMFENLSAGAHGNCTVAVEDAAGNRSNTLALASFSVRGPQVAATGGGSSGTPTPGNGPVAGTVISFGPLAPGVQTVPASPPAPVQTPAPLPAPNDSGVGGSAEGIIDTSGGGSPSGVSFSGGSGNFASTPGGGSIAQVDEQDEITPVIPDLSDSQPAAAAEATPDQSGLWWGIGFLVLLGLLAVGSWAWSRKT